LLIRAARRLWVRQAGAWHRLHQSFFERKGLAGKPCQLRVTVLSYLDRQGQIGQQGMIASGALTFGGTGRRLPDRGIEFSVVELLVAPGRCSRPCGMCDPTGYPLKRDAFLTIA
jgi:hypothetical protein